MTKLRWLAIPLVLAVGMIGMLLRAPVPAQAEGGLAPNAVVCVQSLPNTMTYISPTVTTIPTGTFGVDIVIANVGGLFGADVQFTFDPTLVTVVDAQPGAGVQVTLGPMLTSGAGGYFQIANSADNVAGTVHVALTQLNGSDPVTGTGVLAHITFQPSRTGTGLFHLTNAQLSDRDGRKLCTNQQDGSVTIGVAAAVSVAAMTAREESGYVSAVTSGWPLLLFGAAGMAVVAGVMRLRMRR